MTDKIKENSDNNISIKINEFGLSKIIDMEKVEWEARSGVLGSTRIQAYKRTRIFIKLLI